MRDFREVIYVRKGSLTFLLQGLFFIFYLLLATGIVSLGSVIMTHFNFSF